MKGSFVDTRLADVPAWACGHDGAALQTVLGQDQDAAVRSLEDTVKMASPYLCADDALNACGRRFNLPRYDGEPNGTAPLGGPGGQGASGYRGRLCAAWDAWQWAGTAKAVTDQFVAYGFGAVTVLPVYQAPAPFLPETSSTSYSEFYVFITDMGSTGIVPLVLGSWTLGSASSILGSTMTAAQLAAVKRIILKWKGTHGLPIKLFLVFAGQAIADAPALAQYPIGRTLGGQLTVLGSPGFVLGGYNL